MTRRDWMSSKLFWWVSDMTKKTNIPQVRFKAFNVAWQTHSASNLFSDVVDKGYPDLPVLSATQNAGMVFRDGIGKSVFHDVTNETGYKRVLPGQFVIHLRSFQGGFAHSAIAGITSPAYTVFELKAPEEHDDCYWKYVFSSPNFIKRLEKVTYGIRDGRSISYDEFLTLDFICPSKPEQTRLAEWFSNLDKLIIQHQGKLNKLQNLKASMLEKMFPADGADSPEVRFKGFDKPWETISLGNITSEITRTDKTSNAPIMMITAANGFIDQSDRYSFNNAGQSLAKYIVLKKGELAYNHGASKLRPFGSCFALEVDEARIPYVYHCFAISEHNPYFLSRVLNNKQTEKQLCKLVTSGARMDGLLNISYEEYTTVNVQLPERDEQDLIADYFKNLENLLALYQQELDKLQSLKKGLLEKMFV